MPGTGLDSQRPVAGCGKVVDLIGIKPLVVFNSDDQTTVSMDVGNDRARTMNDDAATPLTAPLRIALLIDHLESDYPAQIVAGLLLDGELVGITALTWGAQEPVHYELLREMLGIAAFACRSLGKSA